MLKEIDYIEHFVTKLAFEEISFKPGTGGSLAYTLDLNKDTDRHLEKENGYMFYIKHVEILVAAENKESAEDAFKLSASFKMVFRAPKEIDEQITAEFFEETEWYFVKFAHQIAHQIISASLTETHFNNVSKVIPRYKTEQVTEDDEQREN